MSRPFWRCEIRLTLVNGQQGVISLDASQLVTLRELDQQFAKARAMAETLCREPAVEEVPRQQPFKVVG
jgi:hypothetical protein